MDSESESIGLPHSDESGEEAEHCGCHGHGVAGHHVHHGHHIHGHHGHGHHELHDGSGGMQMLSHMNPKSGMITLHLKFTYDSEQHTHK